MTRGPDIVDVALHAAARIERQTKMQRQGLPRLAPSGSPSAKYVMVCGLPSSDELEVPAFRPVIGAPCLSVRTTEKLDEVDAGLEPLLRPPTPAAESPSGQASPRSCRDGDGESASAFDRGQARDVVTGAGVTSAARPTRACGS